MALLADGWHMATHAAALGIAGLAYLSARYAPGRLENLLRLRKKAPGISGQSCCGQA
jgi:hypothetical protein